MVAQRLSLLFFLLLLGDRRLLPTDSSSFCVPRFAPRNQAVRNAMSSANSTELSGAGLGLATAATAALTSATTVATAAVLAAIGHRAFLRFASDKQGGKDTFNGRGHPLTHLHFAFRGYSIWLELEQFRGDLDLALDIASRDLHVVRIPGPHVTVVYGMTHLSEDEVLERFDRLRDVVRSWPSFHVKGIHTDTSYDGVDGEDMDMAWIEITLGTSREHQKLVDDVLHVFFDDKNHSTIGTAPDPQNNGELQRPKWKPHLSLVYENPDMAKSNLHYSLTIMKRLPSLTQHTHRRVTAVSLWKTEGKMASWELLRRYPLDRHSPP